MKKIGLGAWLLVGIVVLLVLSSFVSKRSAQKKVERQQDMTSRQVALVCTTDMATVYHIHPNIKIIIDGEDMPIPSNIGVNPGCMNPIHTHEGGGVVHIESPIEKEFMLGDFFAVWKKYFSKEKLLDNIVDENSEITVTVNGQAVETYENTPLKDKDNIVISYGKR